MDDQTTYTGKQDELLDEFASMRNTLMLLVQLIKQQDERIKELEESKGDTNNAFNRVDVLQRFSESAKQYKHTKLDPWRVALVAHLSLIKQLPVATIVNTGLTSKWKLDIVLNWDTQHLLDFCVLNDVSDVYENGLPLYKLREYLPDEPDVYGKLYDVLKDFS